MIAAIQLIARRIGVRIVNAATTVLFVSCPLIALAADNPQTGKSDQMTFHASTSLVLVDVIAQDPKQELAPRLLKQQDLEIRDNGQPTPIVSFDDSTSFETRPIALWFVVICNEGNNPSGSGIFKGKEELFRAALDSLNQHDRVGVAHWCDNGEAEVDLSPTPDRDAAIHTLGKALNPIPWAAPAPIYRRLGELAFQWMLELVVDQAHATRPEPLPVIVCLYGDHSGQPADDLEHLLDYLLSTSGVVYGIKDRAIPDFMAAIPGNRPQVLHYLAAQTGGEYFAVKPDQYGSALQQILAQVHSRYGLGIHPIMDAQRHKLTVGFAQPVRRMYKSVKLRYRTAYTTNFPMNTMADPLGVAEIEDAPVPRRLTFQVKVTRDATAAASPQSSQSKQPYIVDYSIPEQELKFASDSQDKQRYLVRLVVLVYDRNGNKLDEIRGGINLDIEEDHLGEVQKKGILARQTIKLPDQAALLRFLVRDQMGGGIGKLNVTLPVGSTSP